MNNQDRTEKNNTELYIFKKILDMVSMMSAAANVLLTKIKNRKISKSISIKYLKNARIVKRIRKMRENGKLFCNRFETTQMTTEHDMNKMFTKRKP